MAEELRVKFWGVRGSYPATGAATIKYGGNTPCVEIRAGERTIILDAGTGIIPLGRELVRTPVPGAGAGGRTHELLLLFSHLHHDHTQGFPFFAPAFLPNVRLHIFGPGTMPETVSKVLEQNQSPETFPVTLRDMASSKDIQSVHDSQVIIWDKEGIHLMESAVGVENEAIVIRILRSYAHPGNVYIYRISWLGKSIVYATDTEGYIGTDRRLSEFAKDTDVLIHDAQYSEDHYRGQLLGVPSRQGFGHSTVEMACEVAIASRAGQLVLFHHDPSYSDAWIADMEVIAKTRFREARAAYEGMEINFNCASTHATRNRHSTQGKEVQYTYNE